MAPAAGLHFSRELMKRLEIKDCQFAFLTLHSGLGNFREIDVEDLTKHKMDSEQMVVNADVVDIVNKGKDEGHKVCAVGTSVMRAIETAVSTDGHLKEFEGWTNKFYLPVAISKRGYQHGDKFPHAVVYIIDDDSFFRWL